MTWLFSFLSGPILNAITGPILEAYKARLASINTQDAKAVELAVKEIEAEIVSRQAAQAIIIAEQGRWWSALPRPLGAYIVLFYIGKVVVYDAALGLGTTDPVRGDVGVWMGIIITAFYGGRTIEKVAQIFKR